MIRSITFCSRHNFFDIARNTMEKRLNGMGKLRGRLLFMFVDHASRYICAIKTNLMHYLSSVYFVNQPLHVSGIFVAHQQEVYSIYTTIGTCCAFSFDCLLAGQQTVTLRCGAVWLRGKH